MVDDIVREREEGKTVVENSPKGSSGSNGVIERTVQIVEGLIRSILLGLQACLGRKMDARDRIIAFIPEYAGQGETTHRIGGGIRGEVVVSQTKRGQN